MLYNYLFCFSEAPDPRNITKRTYDKRIVLNHQPGFWVKFGLSVNSSCGMEYK